MKIKTALKNAFLIADRVKAVNGLIATPLCEFPGMKIRRMWVFGSTVKGSQNPNDLDLLIEMRRLPKVEVGTRTRTLFVWTREQRAVTDFTTRSVLRMKLWFG